MDKRKTNAERQRAYYYRHKESKRQARLFLGLSTYSKYHKRYYLKQKAKAED